ncbi:unnamed protein product [Cuscuta campestris]|uniref:DUF829 domain-containing protein n=1 Tax=Cuscuta campestris TaxID=132261 RepID=A0A484MDP9_9ASTE|nr:unnamed protein product [Cuscuta campestris]
MWGLGGKHYWGRKEGSEGKVEGIVVVFAWMFSEPNHLKKYVDFYSSLGWNSLVCHSQFLNMFFPDKAAALALEIVNELLEELKARPCPVVFASFSGGPKACAYKALQIIDGKCEEYCNLGGEYSLVRDCVSGHIFDSSPVDFTSDMGTRFLLSPAFFSTARPPPFVRWLAHGFASSLDSLFLSNFEAQRANLWQTLYASVSIGAPYLILCSEDDDIAPCQTIRNFAQRLKDLGGDVKLITWTSSPHVGHYRHHPKEYKEAVTEVLSKSSFVYSKRTCQVKNEKTTTMEHSNCKNYGQPREREGGDLWAEGGGDDQNVPNISTRTRINGHGVLGEILSDVCVPKNVEGWDMSMGPRHSPRLSLAKSVRRSRL